MAFMWRMVVLVPLVVVVAGCWRSNQVTLQDGGVSAVGSNINKIAVTQLELPDLPDSTEESGFSDPSLAGSAVAREDELLEEIRTHYLAALRYLYIDNNVEKSSSEYENCLDDLKLLGERFLELDENIEVDTLGLEKITDKDVANYDLEMLGIANGSSLNGKDQTESGETVFGSIRSFDQIDTYEDKVEYANWLVIGIVDNYRQLLEENNRFDQKIFENQIKKLVYFDIGIGISDVPGTITSEIAMGHSLNYIPMVHNDRVERWIKYFQSAKGKSIFLKWYSRYDKYEKIIRTILKEEGVSEDLIYLGMIESGFHPTVLSRARAAGMWQFMSFTGQRYGLHSDWWYDDRFDVERATRAAAKHLKDLFKTYGDWYLAMAAYNRGEGGTNRAIRINKTRNYWELWQMPRETKNYVPKFMAAALICKDPKKYGFELIGDGVPMTYDTVTVTECIDLEVVAKCADTSFAAIKDLNTNIKRWCTPPTVERFVLKIPAGTREKFLTKYEAVADESRTSWVRHKIQFNETFSSIALKYGTNVQAILDANNMSKNTRLYTGQFLLIPKAPKSSVTKKMAEYKKSSGSSMTYVNKPLIPANIPGKKKVVYAVKSGDTIGEIAEWYNTYAKNIRYWNGLSYYSYIYPGQQLNIWVPPDFPEQGYRKTASKKQDVEDLKPGEGVQIYVVQSGDTLFDIAKLFGVEAGNLRRWNKLSSNTIKPGDKLKVFTK